MRRCLPFLVLLLIPLVTGCVRTINPVLKDDQVLPVDPALLGKWVSKEGTESVDVQRSDKEGTYRALYVEKDGKKGTLLVRLGKVGELTIAELRADDPAPDASDIYKYHLLQVYSFLVVQQTQPQLIFSIMPQDWLKTYVDAHSDELQTFRRDDMVFVTAPTADFQAFLLKHAKDEGALGEPTSFVRPGDPTTKPVAP